MRVPVIEPPPPGAKSLGRAPLVVGALDWFDPEPVCTVIVKVTYSFNGDKLTLAAEQRPLVAADVPSGREALAGEIHEPWDFAPHKPQADLIVVGEAHAGAGRPLRELRARISVGPLARAFRAIPAAPSLRVPLAARVLFREGENEHTRVGARAVDENERQWRAFEKKFDYGIYNVAPPEQQRDYLGPGERVELSGLSPRGEIAFELPEEAPRVLAFWKGRGEATELQMMADTLLVDTAAEACVLVFRGMIGASRAENVDKLCVALEPARGGRPWGDVLRSAARGSFTMSGDPAQVSPAPQGRDEADRLTMARYAFMTQPRPPEPTLSIEQYAAVSAELAEGRDKRVEVLARHELDEDGWLLEERAWLEAMAAQAMEGNGTLAARYGELFVAAQDALAEPHEAKRTVEEYAAIAVALEEARDLQGELGSRGMRLAEWLRLDRRMKKAALADAGVRAQLDRHLAAARRAAASAPRTLEGRRS